MQGCVRYTGPWNRKQYRDWDPGAPWLRCIPSARSFQEVWTHHSACSFVPNVIECPAPTISVDLRGTNRSTTCGFQSVLQTHHGTRAIVQFRSRRSHSHFVMRRRRRAVIHSLVMPTRIICTVDKVLTQERASACVTPLVLHLKRQCIASMTGGEEEKGGRGRKGGEKRTSVTSCMFCPHGI